MLNKLTKITALSALVVVASQASFAEEIPTAHQSIQPITETILLSEKFGKSPSLLNFKSTAKFSVNDRLSAESISDDYVLINDDFVSGVVVSSDNAPSINLSASVENIAEDEFFTGLIGETGVLLDQISGDEVAFVPTARRSVQPISEPILLSEKFGPVTSDDAIELANR